MLTADEALSRLREGNHRFTTNVSSNKAYTWSLRKELAEGQHPFAVVVGCSDSRVPVEIVFDQGLGDLFVIRVAGNIVAPSQIGSVEFAIEQFGTRLVVVMGHTQCGAIKAAVDDIAEPSPNLQSIVSRVKPAVDQVLADGGDQSNDALVARAVEANVRASVRQLEQGSDIIHNFIQNKGLKIIGAEYSLDSGEVRFF